MGSVCRGPFTTEYSCVLFIRDGVKNNLDLQFDKHVGLRMNTKESRGINSTKP
jgi:hypothetical protein